MAKVDDSYINRELYNQELDFYSKYYEKKKGKAYLEEKVEGEKTRADKLKEDLLSSLIYDQIMANDMQAGEKNNEIVDDLSKEEESSSTLSGNLAALNFDPKSSQNIIKQDEIRDDHYEYFLKTNDIKDKDILEVYKKNKYYQKQYKYNALVFEDENESKTFREGLDQASDFKKALNEDVKNYKVLNSDFVYEDDSLLSLSKEKEKDKISQVFEKDGKYYILMVNSYNTNENELLIKAKESYLKEKYQEYLKSLRKKANIKVFI